MYIFYIVDVFQEQERINTNSCPIFFFIILCLIFSKAGKKKNKRKKQRKQRLFEIMSLEGLQVGRRK